MFKKPILCLKKACSKRVLEQSHYEISIRVDSESEPLISQGERYDISYDIENNGQTTVENIEFDICGVNRNCYELSPSSISSLDSVETATVELSLDSPEEFQTPLSIEFEATGTAGGKEIKGSATTLVSFDESSSGTEEDENIGDENETASETNTTEPGMQNRLLKRLKSWSRARAI